MISYPRIVRLAPALFLIIRAGPLNGVQGGGYDDSTIASAASVLLALAFVFRTRSTGAADHRCSILTSRRIQRDGSLPNPGAWVDVVLVSGRIRIAPVDCQPRLR